MTTITGRLRCGGFTAAEEYLLRLLRLIFDRFKIGAFVGAVAKRLRCTLPTGTPKIRFARLNVYCIRGI